MSDPTIPAEAATQTCQARDMGYPAECTHHVRFRAEKHQAVSFVLCGQHLHRAWRAGYHVAEIQDAKGSAHA